MEQATTAKAVWGTAVCDDSAKHRLPWWSPVLLLATGFGLGYSPVAPGTVGSLLGLPVLWLAASLKAGPLAILVAVVVSSGIAVPVCSAAGRHFGKSDPGQVVLDEIVALPLAVVAVPLTIRTALLGFVWFRLFDVLKPWPVRWAERLPEGVGIVADDLIAGLYAAAATWATVQMLPVS